MTRGEELLSRVESVLELTNRVDDQHLWGQEGVSKTVGGVTASC